MKCNQRQNREQEEFGAIIETINSKGNKKLFKK